MRRLSLFLAGLLFASAAWAQSYPSPVFSGVNVAAGGSYKINGVAAAVYALSSGVVPGAADSSSNLQAAIDAVSTAGGGSIILPAGTINVAGVVLKSNVYLRGQGRGQTVLKLKDSANVDVLYGLDAYTLFGTLSTGGIYDWGLSDLTVDGNRANNTNGSCLAVYGYRYTIENVIFQNCAINGIRSEGGQPISAAMEASISNVLIDTTGQHGAYFNGPHDSVIDNLIVIDAGQSANSTYDGMFFDTHMNARVSAFHGWHRSTATNRVRSQFYDTSGSSNFTGSHFEGASYANIILAGTNSSFDNSNMYYAAWNGLNMVIRGPGNKVAGVMQVPGAGRPASVGLTLGLGSDNAGANNIDLSIWGNAAGAVDFSHSAGNNKVRVHGYQSTGPKYLGSPLGSDDVDLVMPGGATGADIHQATGAHAFDSATIGNSFTTSTPLTIDSAANADTSRGLALNIGGSTYARMLVKSGGGGALAFWTGSIGAPAERMVLDASGNLTFTTGAPQIPAKTVATLPTCGAGAAGQVYYVTDANAPTWNATLAGGGAVKTLALCSGSAWTAH